MIPTNRRDFMKVVTIYTDGACSGNPGPGGWGAFISWNGHQKDLNGGEADTTNNRMELMAAIMAMETLKESCQIELYTDSTYVMKGMTEWLEGWKAKNWKTANKKPVKNKDLWERFDVAIQRHKVNFHWVKGHAGDPGNERADELARQGISLI